ncbi:GntR family transcriptional regulator [Aciditerrimonas ferrireducens]|uniref:GntR family transcriptional regulator n=1 Tax=Aciditerrimonas ferrireducens TaxID=667306 RepID=UPI00200485DB|nr:GntR family transcriptional regulator [Aciditerrimonas ferrireducens]MCK4176481.1 GntR family transcriptional regulator [Aciditerrimonas ferrireducens]
MMGPGGVPGEQQGGAGAKRPGRSAADRAYLVVREAIASGRLRGGEPVREEQVAKEIGVSRTPVREALRRLAAEGLVELEARRGARVARFEAEEVDEIFSLRVELESHAAALAAQRAGADDVAKLAALCEEMREAAEAFLADPCAGLEAVTDLNNRFHAKVLEVAGNRRLASVVEAVVQRALVERTFHGYSADQLRRSCRHHEEVVEAIAAGDPEWAEAVMRTHILAGRAVAKGVAQ